jgi:hypothetical protein
MSGVNIHSAYVCYHHIQYAVIDQMNSTLKASSQLF